MQQNIERIKQIEIVEFFNYMPDHFNFETAQNMAFLYRLV